MGQIQGRACINRAPLRAYIPKEEAAYPTISMESTFITATISASKRRKVQYYDVPSAFVNTEVNEDVLMVLKGELTIIWCKLRWRCTKSMSDLTEKVLWCCT
jgi:hypothetical protein